MSSEHARLDGDDERAVLERSSQKQVQCFEGLGDDRRRAAIEVVDEDDEGTAACRDEVDYALDVDIGEMRVADLGPVLGILDVGGKIARATGDARPVGVCGTLHERGVEAPERCS